MYNVYSLTVSLDGGELHWIGGSISSAQKVAPPSGGAVLPGVFPTGAPSMFSCKYYIVMPPVMWQYLVTLYVL